MTMAETIVLELDGSPFPVELFSDRAPASCRAILSQVPLADQIIHARLSGPLCLLRRVNLADAPLENPVSFFDPGDIVYHPAHFDIGIAYGPTQFRELAGTVYVSLVGRIGGDLSPLIATGRSLLRTGARPIFLRAA